MITSKSLFNSNIAFVFNEKNFIQPENEQFASLFGGEKSKGARFIDDPIIKAKVLTLPNTGLKLTLENRRLIIDDQTAKEPKESFLIAESVAVIDKLFKNNTLDGFGFNFDVYYRFNNVIPIKDIFENFFGEELLKKNDLRDFGFQFTLEKKKDISEVWFLKITAPLELAVHFNRHFQVRQLPALEHLRQMFENCYNEMDEVIKNFKTGFDY